MKQLTFVTSDFRCVYEVSKSEYQLCHVCPSVHMEQLDSYGTDFCEILYWEVLLKSEQQIQF